MIKVHGNTSVQRLACSFFSALSGNTDLQVHPTRQRTDDQSEDEDNMDESKIFLVSLFPSLFFFFLTEQTVWYKMTLYNVV